MRSRIIAGALAAFGVFGSMDSVNASIVDRWDANTLSSSDGTLIGTWSDSVGGKTLTATSTAQPTYRPGGINGHPSLEFNGTANFLKTGVAINAVKTVVAVAIADTGLPNLATLVSANADTRNVRVNDSTNFYRSEGHGGDNNEFYKTDGSATGNDGAYVNNVLSGSFTYDVSHVIVDESDAAIDFTDFAVGNSAFGRFWKGDVGEVILFDNALTADERAGVAHNLSVKWGFATEVPANQSQIDAANALGVTVPEPACLSIVGIGGFLISARRRR